MAEERCLRCGAHDCSVNLEIRDDGSIVQHFSCLCGINFEEITPFLPLQADDLETYEEEMNYLYS